MVKSEKFSEIMQRAINAYLNGMLTNEEVIAEMLKLAKQLAEAHKEGEQLGLQLMSWHSTMHLRNRKQSRIFTKMKN